MGKREEAHRELEHALAALADVAPDNDRAWKIKSALGNRNLAAWIAFDRAQSAVWQAANSPALLKRPTVAWSMAAMRKLAPVLLDILLGEEE